MGSALLHGLDCGRLLEGDEAEPPGPASLAVAVHRAAVEGAELLEVLFQVGLAQTWVQATHEHLAVSHL